MLNAVGIDVSKGRSTVAVLQPGGVVVRKPFDVYHKQSDLKELTSYIKFFSNSIISFNMGNAS